MIAPGTLLTLGATIGAVVGAWLLAPMVALGLLLGAIMGVGVLALWSMTWRGPIPKWVYMAQFKECGQGQQCQCSCHVKKDNDEG